MARKKRHLPKWWRRLPMWVRVAFVGLAPLCLFNLTVAFFGNSVIFPLSPFFLKNKARALGHYALHRPWCLFRGHAHLDAVIARAEGKHQLPRGLLAALVQVESGGRVHRISSAGAMGPAQLTPGTARLLGVSDPFDPEEGLHGSARYLAAQLAAFRSIPLALAAYNAGPGAIVNRKIPANGETQAYVRKIMELYRDARGLAAPSADE